MTKREIILSNYDSWKAGKESWKESKGAMMEHQFALDNNIKIIYQ